MLIEKRILGSIMYLYDNDPGSSAQLLLSEKREWDCPYIYHQLIRDDFIVLDIGANLGYYALAAAKLAGYGHVFAIEPSPKNIFALRKAIEANEYSNITTHEIAIGDKIGSGKFSIRENGNVCSMADVYTRPREANEYIEVPVTTVDQFCEDLDTGPISMLRFDVEGYEIQVIEGAQKTLDRMPLGSWVFGEFHAIHFEDASILQPTIDNIISHGFVHRRVVPITPLEWEKPEDLGRLVCTDFADTCPRIFFEKM